MPWDNPIAKQIAVLRTLDQIDKTIVDLGAKRDEARAAVEKLKEEIASFHSGIADFDREIQACETQQKTAELELDRVEKKLKKLSRGLTSGSEKEYDASRREQAHLASRKSELEDEILACMELSDDLHERKAAFQKHIAERRRDITAQYESLKLRYEQLGIRLAEHKRDRDLVIPQLDPDGRYTYQRLMQRYGDRATVSVVGDRCTGCQLHVPPQHVVDVLTGRGLHNCQHCGRFVLPEEPLGAEDEQTD